MVRTAALDLRWYSGGSSSPSVGPRFPAVGDRRGGLVRRSGNKLGEEYEPLVSPQIVR